MALFRCGGGASGPTERDAISSGPTERDTISSGPTERAVVSAPRFYLLTYQTYLPTDRPTY